MSNAEKKANREIEARADWFVTRLYSGEMTGAEESELHDWLAVRPDHRAAYERVLELWDMSSDLADDEDIARLADKAMQRTEPSRNRRPWLAIAASLVLMVTAGLLVNGIYSGSDAPQVLETAVGEQQIVALEDGTSITLNTGSRVLVDFTDEERRVVLDFGEVFLDVAKDPNRPLTVYAGDRLVTVLGTQFSVLLTGDEVQVAVVEGTVAVSDEKIRFPQQSTVDPGADADTVYLTAGAVAQFANDQEVLEEINLGEVQRLQSWRKGLVRFNSRPLIEIVSEVNRYSPVKILIEDSSIADMPISAALRLNGKKMVDEVEILLSSFEEVYDIKVVRHPDRYGLVADDK